MATKAKHKQRSQRRYRVIKDVQRSFQKFYPRWYIRRIMNGGY